MDDEKKSRKEWLLKRRDVLKIAGFTVAGAAMGLPIANVAAAKQIFEGGAAASSDSAYFQHLFTPLKIGSFTVRNRILSTAHFTGFGERGLPFNRHKNYWGSKARGGIGLIITEVQPVHPTGGIWPSMIQCYRDGVAKAFKPIVEDIHQAGGKIIAQSGTPANQPVPTPSKRWCLLQRFPANLTAPGRGP